MNALEAAAPAEQRLDARELMAVFWRRKWLFLLCLVLIPAAVYAVSSQLEEQYKSDVVLNIQSSAVDTSLFQPDLYTPPERSLNAAARLVKTTGVAQEAARRLREPRGAVGGLLSSIEAKADDTTGFITITATSSDPRRAADIADAFSSAVVATRSRQAQARIDKAIGEVTNDLGRIKPDDRDGRRQLSQQLQRLRALRAAQGSNAQVIEPAGVPTSPASPKPKRNAALGLIVAILVGAGLIFLAENLDRRLRRPEELERLTGVPLLAVVPESAFPGHRPDPRAGIAFQGLRDTLTYFNVDRPIRSIAITSPVKGDGKTTVATNLAVAVARSGKRVILVEADLRHPRIATRMGLEGEGGLSSVLAQGPSAAIPLEDVPPFGPSLRVLTSGPTPPNPSELIGSSRMRTLLDELVRMADLVVIDTPPLLTVSDALPLLERVSGTVVVARLGHTQRDAVSRLMQISASAGAHILGTVATGTKATELYAYGGYAYVPEKEVEAADARVSANGRESTRNGRRSRRRRAARTEQELEG